MPSLTISPDTFVATSTANAAVASWSGTSWTTPPALTATGPTITILSFDVTTQTARLSVDAGSAVGPVVVSDASTPALAAALEVTPFYGLVSLAFAQQALAAAGRALTAAQLATLPGKINTASTAARRWCNDRRFTRQVLTEYYRSSQNGQVSLKQVPVNRVLRVSRGLVDALTVTANSTAQIANVVFAQAGDFTSGLAVTGIELTATVAGTRTVQQVPFADNPTVGSVAAAIDALGPPWSAMAAAEFSPWPSSELTSGDLAKGAIGGATFQLFSQDAPVGRLDPGAGVLTLDRPGLSDFFGPRWGPDWGLWLDGSPTTERIRVTYDAGFDQIPGPVQDAVVLLIGWLFDNPARDLALSSESVGAGSYVLNTAFEAPDFPKVVKAILAPYRIWRV